MINYTLCIIYNVIRYNYTNRSSYKQTFINLNKNAIDTVVILKILFAIKYKYYKQRLEKNIKLIMKF